MRIINCARGGLVDEEALRKALDAGHVAGAAFDVFVTEPATSNVLFGHPHVVCTPHLGASTTEAQEQVALQVAEQMSDFLMRGAIANAVEFSLDHRRGGAALASLHRACGKARPVRRANCPRRGSIRFQSNMKAALPNKRPRPSLLRPCAVCCGRFWRA